MVSLIFSTDLPVFFFFDLSHSTSMYLLKIFICLVFIYIIFIVPVLHAVKCSKCLDSAVKKVDRIPTHMEFMF